MRWAGRALGVATAVAFGWLLAVHPALASEDLAQGAALYGEHCASCHGKNLEGEPD